jgi:hypothetical protein
LLVGGNGCAGRRWAAVIAASGRAAVAVPDEAVQVVVAVGLIVGQRAAALRRNGGVKLDHVAQVVIAARLAKEWLRLPRDGRADRERALDAVIAERRAEDGVSGRAGLGAGAAQRQAGDLPPGGVADLPDQEVHWIGAAWRAEIGQLRAPVTVIVGGHGLAVGSELLRCLTDLYGQVAEAIAS